MKIPTLTAFSVMLGRMGVTAVLAAVAMLARGGRPVVPAGPGVRVPGSRPASARPENEIGASDPALPMERIILSLKLRDGAREELDEFLRDLQDPASPSFHRWLSPEEFGSRFGISDAGLNEVVEWLSSRGFVVEGVARGRTWINFTGSAAQVAQAFGTEIRDYLVEGEVHHANATDIVIPGALARWVNGPVSLSDFRRRSGLRKREPVAARRPLVTVSPTIHYLAPADFWTIYDSTPLIDSGMDGRGASVAVVGRTDIKLSDVQLFRSSFGLPANDPVFVHNGPDPGNLGGNEEGEADLDVQWAGAVAPGATITLVISASTNSADGVDLSAQAIVDQNLAPVLTTSFGLCESQLTPSGNSFYENLWAQAAAEGISVFVASGDSGAADCDDPTQTTARGGPAVDGLCSIPNDTCVGGTEFLDTASPQVYWTTDNDPIFQSSARSYIPEEGWNESAGTAGGTGLYASGGGRSTIYPKPPWQVAPGVPADGFRDVPDVALNSADHDGALAEQDGQQFVFSGTSVTAPDFAGIAAILVGATGSRQGNLNPRLYELANAQYASGGPAVFHDVVTGNNSVPGQTGSACTAGYDLVTGLGSVDIDLLVRNWTQVNRCEGCIVPVPTEAPRRVDGRP